ncbi:hypothetical protein [Ewingella americana]|uniref:hypothetical protein n=1 Tax=Ewingella americana TaxID=41202 RepID=UPI001F33D185|nr:hypothetical protein [Ewingella americana]
MSVPLLCHVPLEAGYPERFAAAGFELHYAMTPESRADLDPAVAEKIRAVLTIGTIGLTGEEMDKLPNLEIICAQGVGYELVDVAAAKQRGIVVTHGPGTNSSSVADHTLALMLAITRQIPRWMRKCAVATGPAPVLTLAACLARNWVFWGWGISASRSPAAAPVASTWRWATTTATR